MIRNHMRGGRVLIFTAICIGILVLFEWFLAKLMLADEAGLRAESVASREARNCTEIPGWTDSQARKVPVSDQISNRVKSLLSIRSDEIGLITIPKSKLDLYFDSSMNPDESEPPFPVLQTIVPKKSLASGLEGVLKEGGALTVRVAGHDATELSGNGFHVQISSVSETEFVSTVRLQMTSNGVTVPYELSLYPDHALVFRLPPPAEVGVAILIGDDPDPPNAIVR